MTEQSQVALRAPEGHMGHLRDLWRAASEERLPHALLLQGPEGIGKFLAARWLSMGLLCSSGPGEPCGTCGPCKRVLSGGHADVHVADAASDGQEILSIFYVAHREIRPPSAYQGPSIEDFLMLKAQEGGWRTIIVRDAELLNMAAQNAFLKMLEEPRPGVLILLTSSQPSALLETVRSRVVCRDLWPLSLQETRTVLRGLEVPEDTELAAWGGGSPGRAYVLHQRAGLDLRRLILDVLHGRRLPHAAALGAWEVEGDFSARTPAAEKRVLARTFVDIGLDLMLDLERLHAGLPPQDLAQGNVLEGLERVPESLRRQWVEAWLLARRDIGLNLNPEGILERALQALRPTTPAAGSTAT